jgi:hypothetical protein
MHTISRGLNTFGGGAQMYAARKLSADDRVLSDLGPGRSEAARDFRKPFWHA